MWTRSKSTSWRFGVGFELYTAIQRRDEVVIDVILSPKQAKSFRDRINRDGTDAHAIDGALGGIESADAETSVPADTESIRSLIQSYAGGFGTLNDTVRQYLRRWFVVHGGVKVAPQRRTAGSGPAMDTAGRTVERVPVAQFVASARPAGSSSGVAHSTSAGARRQPDSSVSMFVSNPAYAGDGGYMDVEGTASPPARLASDVSLITDTGFRQESDDSLITDVNM